jgi:hypothetical protein
MIFGREPAAIAAFVQAILALAVGFGLNLSTEQMGLLMAVVTLGLGLLVRQVVTPLAAPKLAGGTSVEVEGTGKSVQLPETDEV